MARLRMLLTAVLALTLVTGVSGCGQIFEVLNPSTGEELVGTSWSGTDSDGDEWGFTFQADGGVALTFNGNQYDDDSDVWEVKDGVIGIGIVFDDGVATLTGPYTRNTDVITLDGEQGDISWTLEITRD